MRWEVLDDAALPVRDPPREPYRVGLDAEWDQQLASWLGNLRKERGVLTEMVEFYPVLSEALELFLETSLRLQEQLMARGVVEMIDSREHRRVDSVEVFREIVGMILSKENMDNRLTLRDAAISKCIEHDLDLIPYWIDYFDAGQAFIDRLPQ